MLNTPSPHQSGQPKPQLCPSGYSFAQAGKRGFTLIVTLAILAAVTILVVGLFGIVTRERQVSSTYDSVDQADLAVQAGLDRAGAMLQRALVDETGVLFAAPLEPGVDPQGRAREMLLSANYDAQARHWKYQALASGVAEPPPSEVLDMPEAGFEKLPALGVSPEALIDDATLENRRLPRHAPWRAQTPKFWMEVRLPSVAGDQADSAEEELVGRYCFHVEDLEGKLNLANAGYHNLKTNLPERPSEHAEAEQPGLVPVIPGLLIDAGGRWRRHPSSVWTLLQPAVEPVSAGMVHSTFNLMHRRLTGLDSKRMAFSPDMWREVLVAADPVSGWPGLDPLKLGGKEARLPDGSLADPQLRVLEENTTGALRPYEERALIPHGPGIAFAGEPKLNLNQILEQTGGAAGQTAHAKMKEAVDQIAAHIDRHLPEFRKRAGGFTLPRRLDISQSEGHQLAYLKTLAAGMLDYADKDSLPSINMDRGGRGSEDAESLIEYRGMDSFPLINEYWSRQRFERFLGRQVECSLTDYAELWNMTNQEVSGEVTAAFEYKGRFVVGLRSYQVMSSLDKVVSGRPVQIPGLEGQWFSPQRVTLRPNEIKVMNFVPVRFQLDGGELGNVTGVQYLGQPKYGNDERESRYRLAFKPDGASEFTVVDYPFAPIERYQMTSNLSIRQRFNVNQCGLSYRLRDKDWAFNVGDTRAAYFIDYHQEVIDYDDGSSPWGRNYRRFERMAGEVRTFLWPDGGHNSIPCPTRIGSFDRNPDDITMRPPTNPSNSLAERQKFVQRISNAGRFYSMTELGHVFDPIMWDPNGKGWKDEEVLYSEHADLRPDVVELEPNHVQLDAHKRYCGGNTLRIGRVEHTLFRPDYRKSPERGRPDNRGLAASTLLDLFHCGDANSLDPQKINGPLVRIEGHVNVNTASRDTLRALVAGRLTMDPRLKKDSADGEPSPDTPNVMLAPSTSKTKAQADVVADAIIRNRPYVSPAEVAEKAVLSPQQEADLQEHDELLPLEAHVPVFGHTKRVRTAFEDRQVWPEWNDGAAEEVFARLWNNGSVRSRHFQVVVSGQAVKISRSGETRVMATRSRLFHVFIRPIRRPDGTLERQVIEITYSRAL